MLWDPEEKQAWQAFIKEHLLADPHELALRKPPFPPEVWRFLLTQIEARQKAGRKLPSWVAAPDVVFPDKVAVEQASAEVLALWKAREFAAEAVCDLSGGLGADAWAFGQKALELFFLEPEPERAQAFAHNAQVLGGWAPKVFPTTAQDFLAQFAGWQCPLFYLDPDRRPEKGPRKVALADTTPAVLELLPQLLQQGEQVLLKASPMLDISAAVGQLKAVEEIFILSVEGEVKELLFSMRPGLEQAPEQIPRTAVLFSGLGERYRYTLTAAEEKAAQPQWGGLAHYVGLPDAALTKAGAFRKLAADFGLRKLGADAHLYSSEQRPDFFPGRVFEKLEAGAFQAKQARAWCPEGRANLIVRNVSGGVQGVARKLKLKLGGQQTLLVYNDGRKTRMALLRPLSAATASG